MLVMALEAARAAAISKKRKVSGFLLKDVQFLAPVVVRKDIQDSAETMVELRPILNIHDKESLRSEVRLYCCLDGTWTLNFRTEIEVQCEESRNLDAAWKDETHHQNIRIREHITSAFSTCTSEVERCAFFRFCEKQGLRYGPSFQLLRDIAWDGHQTSTAQVEMRPVPTLHGNADSPVHPAVLDAVLQLLLVQLSKGAVQSFSTPVPKTVSTMWISSKHWVRSTSFLKICSSLSVGSGSGSSVSGTMELVDDDGFPLCTIQDVSMVEVSRNHNMNDDRGHDSRSLLHNIAWKPRLSSLDAETLTKLCNSQAPNRSEAMQEAFYPKMELAMRVAARKAVAGITDDEIIPGNGYIKKYVASLRHRYGTRCSNPEEMISDSGLEELLEECEKEQPHWRMFPAVARALPSIIRGETSALNLLFSSKAAEEFYIHAFDGIIRDDRLGKFMDMATHEKPDLNILEVGAGTGGMTRCILKMLRDLEHSTGQTRFSEYTYTDISLSFFEEGRKKFEEFKDRLTFKILDLEKDPLQQGYQANAYDMIFAGSVLHVTSDLVATLRRCRKLLKPGGHLVFIEITSLNSACANVGFGSLEGWWFGNEAWRQYGPLATETRWDELLRQSGFSGTNLSLRDYESDVCHLTSTMVSKALVVPENEFTPNGLNRSEDREITLLVNPESGAQFSLVNTIKQVFPRTRSIPLHNKPSSGSDIVVSLLEFDVPRLAALDELAFEDMKDHIKAAKSLVWVTCGKPNGRLDPHASLASGLLRLLRNELDNKHIVTLSIESCAIGDEANYIVKTIQACFLEPPQSPEVEFVVRDGLLNIGRLAEEKRLDAKRLRLTRPEVVSEAWEPGPKLSIEFRNLGMLDSLQFVEDNQGQDLAPGEVEIQAAVWPISFRDLFIALGRLGNEKLGIECAGTVSRVGSACKNDFIPGDRVLMVVPGCMRSHPRAPAHSVFKLPDSMTFHQAVAGMNPCMTACESQ